MKVYLPNCFAKWLQTSPQEGQVLVVALLTKLHSIYGVDTYFEMYNDDLDAINHTAIKGSAVTEIKKLQTMGIVKQARGLEMRITLRISENLFAGLDRRSLYTDSIPYDLSLNGAMLWTYVLGRMANVDENIEITVINKVREYSNTQNSANFRGKEKKATSHILPQVYRDLFLKEVGQAFKGVTEFKELNHNEMTKKEYGQVYYEMRKADVLEKKRQQYQEKKNKENGIN